jgi:hypothetical protein
MRRRSLALRSVEVGRRNFKMCLAQPVGVVVVWPLPWPWPWPGVGVVWLWPRPGAVVACEREPGSVEEDPGGVAFEWVVRDEEGELIGAGVVLGAAAVGETVGAGAPLPLVPFPVPPPVEFPLPPGRLGVPWRRVLVFVTGRGFAEACVTA